MMERIIEWLNSHMFTCFYKKYLGMDCPGCGLQRSFIALMQGDFEKSFELYPALIPLMVMFAFLTVHLKQKFTYGAAILKYMFVFCTIIIFSTYIYKNFIVIQAFK